jgi:uncharacterized membrane protein YeaQ/YmgE (transglycosylase-associated protein family)
MIKKIEKRLTRSKRRTFGLYNNIIAGIITGASVGSVLPNFKNFLEEGWISNWILNIALMIIFLIVYYNIGKWAVRHAVEDSSEDLNYNKNFITGIIAAFYVSLMLLGNIYLRWSLIPLSVIVLIVVLYLYAKPKKRE